MTLTLEQGLTFEELSVEGYEKVLLVKDSKAGLHAIICIHDTTMGPALGGTRIYPYENEADALRDVKRLAKGMTYKSAMAESGFGGGKSVIIANPKQKTKELLLAFGQAVTKLQGKYICAEDLGSTPDDLAIVAQATPYVVGLVNQKSSGNPSPYTAWGTFRGIQAVLQQIYQNDTVKDRKIVIQGLGSVGERLSEILFWHGAKLAVYDIDAARAKRVAALYGAELLEAGHLYSTECDVFSPCAIGGILNPETIAKLRAKGVAGSANNQLLQDSDADLMMKRGILYAPDFVINAGGLINVTCETYQEGYNPLRSRDLVDKLYEQLTLIFDLSKKNRTSTHLAAVQLADYRLKYGIGKRKEPIYMHHANFRFRHS